MQCDIHTRTLPSTPVPCRAVLLEYYHTIGTDGPGGAEEAARLRARAAEALTALGATAEELAVKGGEGGGPGRCCASC